MTASNCLLVALAMLSVSIMNSQSPVEIRNERTEVHVQFPNSPLWITPPEGFEFDSTLPAFKSKRMYNSLAATSLFLGDLEQNVAEFRSRELSYKSTILNDIPLKINGLSGHYLQSKRTGDWRQFCLFLGIDSVYIRLTGVIQDASETDSLLLKSMFSVVPEQAEFQAFKEMKRQENYLKSKLVDFEADLTGSGFVVMPIMSKGTFMAVKNMGNFDDLMVFVLMAVWKQPGETNEPTIAEIEKRCQADPGCQFERKQASPVLAEGIN